MNDQPERSEDFHRRVFALQGCVSEADVAELRKDAARLDWLDGKRKHETARHFTDIRCVETELRHVGWSWILDADNEDNIRDAIDKAMNKAAP